MQNPIEKKLDSLFVRCGINADWSVSVWCVNGKPNTGRGVYITDNDDGTMSLVSRNFDVMDDIGETIATWDATWPSSEPTVENPFPKGRWS